MEKFAQKKLADVQRTPERMAEQVALVVRLEMIWLNGPQGNVIEHYLAMNQAQVDTAKILLEPGALVASLAFEMVQRLVGAFRMTHGQNILTRALQLVADVKAGMVQVIDLRKLSEGEAKV